MKTKKIASLLLTAVLLFGVSLMIIGCDATEAGEEEASAEASGEELYITASFSVLADIIEEVIGDRGTVDYVVPIGEEPHEYEPTPGDFAKISDSDVFYVNGLNLEEWLEKVVSDVAEIDVVTLSDGIDPVLLDGGDEPDPHAWLSPQRVIYYVENLVEDLIERDPEGEETYRSNGDAYISELEELDQWIQEQTALIPEEQRVIILSEDAFKYFGEDYGYHTEGIWDINSSEEGTPQQFSRLIDLVNEKEVPALFRESTIDPRYMDTISEGTGVPITGEVFTDAVGPEGEDANTYIGMMRENMRVFVEGLGSGAD